ncbi:M16 family metallopeptidase [Pseudomonas cremoricolorata]|uniref:M16 family metallopeptidase n=1 Tax=Pseudomonas cremoricolorata TaxID=157783 RepID=UPI00041D08FA|nr:pitrilysin family protein [Pseudomonas cremoricolorata]
MQPSFQTSSRLGRSSSPLAHFTLDNGLRVILVQDHRVPLVSAQLWYHVGASHEPHGQSGLSHALEHWVFEGSSKLAPGQYAKVLARLGAKPLAFTLDEATLYVASVPANRLEIVLEAQADIMSSATLAEQDFVSCRDALINEHRLRVESSADEQASRLHLQLAHGASPYAHSRYDHLDDLQGLGADAVRAWYAKHYHPSNATLVVAGDIRMPALREQVERHFDALPTRPKHTDPGFRQTDTLFGREQTVRLPALRQGVILSFNTPSLGSTQSPAEVIALQVAAALLSNGASSRLYAALVRDQPLLRGIRSEFDVHLRGDTLMTWHSLLSPGRTSPEQASARMLAVIDTLSHTPVSTVELQRAKTKLLAQLIYQRDALQDHAYHIGRHALSGADLDLLERTPELIQSVTADAVHEVARRYFTANRLTVTYTQPEEAAQ